MIREKNNLNYEYFNRYLTNCGGLNPPNMELLNEFFKEKLNLPPEHELDPKKVVFLDELVTFCRNKFDGSN